MGSQTNHFHQHDAVGNSHLSSRTPARAWKTVLKLCVGCLLLFYVLRSEMINFKNLGSALLSPKTLLTSLIFLGTSALLCSFRWYQIASVQNLRLSFRQVFELTMIGNFFNTFLPGAVGGDLIKAWYIADHSMGNRTRGVFTVLLDRMIGLAVIIFYAAITLLFFWELLQLRHQLQVIAWALWAFTGSCAVGALLFFSPVLWRMGWFSAWVKRAEKWEALGKVVTAATLYRHQLRTILFSLFLSGLSILCTTILYSIHGKSLGIALTTGHYFFVVPIGIVASAVPLLPGGLGVGQVAFFTLFRWVGETPEYGGTLCTLIQLHTILFNCIGLIFYLKHKRNVRAFPVPVTN